MNAAARLDDLRDAVSQWELSVEKCDELLRRIEQFFSDEDSDAVSAGQAELAAHLAELVANRDRARSILDELENDVLELRKQRRARWYDWASLGISLLVRRICIASITQRLEDGLIELELKLAQIDEREQQLMTNADELGRKIKWNRTVTRLLKELRTWGWRMVKLIACILTWDPSRLPDVWS